MGFVKEGLTSEPIYPNQDRIRLNPGLSGAWLGLMWGGQHVGEGSIGLYVGKPVLSGLAETKPPDLKLEILKACQHPPRPRCLLRYTVKWRT